MQFLQNRTLRRDLLLLKRKEEDDRASATGVYANIEQLKTLFHQYNAQKVAEIAELEKVVRKFEITDETLAAAVQKDELATQSYRGKTLVLFLPLLNNGTEVLIKQKVRTKNIPKNILDSLKYHYLK